METHLIFKIFVVFLIGKSANSILVGNEKPGTKPSEQTEDLPWLNFGPSLPNDDDATIGRSSKQYSHPNHNSLCPPGVTGQFPYPPDCKRFINCWKGRGMIQVCGPGTLFNSESRECDYPDKVKCAHGEAFGASPQSRFPVHRPGTSENLRVSRQDDRRGQSSIPATNYPGRPPYFGPSHLTRPPTRPTSAPNDRLVEEVSCPVGGAGLYPHPSDCSRFLNCWGGRMFIQKCGPGTLFDPDSGVCDHANVVKCKNGQPEAAYVPLDVNNGDVESIVEERPEGNPQLGDLHNSATNLYDVRSKTKKDDRKEILVEESEAKTERDPSWGKILNWGGSEKQQPAGNRVYYDAHGNPINQDQYRIQIGKPVLHNRPTPETQQPGRGNPGEASGYYLRPHNHVMNQNPPHLHNHGGHHQAFHNQQHGHPLTPKPNSPQNSIPGHFILVEDSKVRDQKVSYDSHQKGDEPPTYLVPPRFEGTTGSSAHNSGHSRFEGAAGATAYNTGHSQFHGVQAGGATQSSGHSHHAGSTASSTQNSEFSHQAGATGASTQYSAHSQHTGVSGSSTHNSGHFHHSGTTGASTLNAGHSHHTGTTGASTFNAGHSHHTGTTGASTLNAGHSHHIGTTGASTLNAGHSHHTGTTGASTLNAGHSHHIGHTGASTLNAGHFHHAGTTGTSTLNSGHSHHTGTTGSSPQNSGHFHYTGATGVSAHNSQHSWSEGVSGGSTQSSGQTLFEGASGILTQNEDQIKNTPSAVLLPPIADDTNHHQHHSATNQLIKYDYANWKPYYNDRVPPSYANVTEVPKRENDRYPNEHFNLKVDSYSSVRETSTATDWSQSSSSKDSYAPGGGEAEATTTDGWNKFYGNKNPYGVRTSAATTISPEEESAPTTTNRVYVVYPVKNPEISDQTVDSYYAHQSHVKTKQHHREEIEVATNKRLKSEVESEDSTESLSVRDVELYTPTIEDLIPNAGKNVRLKPLSGHLDGYVEVKGPNGEWGLVCDEDNGWMIPEANVVCKELGYGRGAQISWQGYPLDSSTESIPVSVSEVRCNGSEDSLLDCNLFYGDRNCDITKNAVGLRCFDNVTSQCHPEEVEYNNSCYRLIKRDDLDDAGFSLEEAAEHCKTLGGRISDVTTEEENDFLSEWLMEKYPDVRSVLTGGIGSSVMGRSLWMWFQSETPMLYQKWWKGWAGENEVKQGTVHGPVCVVLRKSFPCFVQETKEDEVAIELGNVEPEYCSANYFYWDIEDCDKLGELNLPHICKKPLEEVGCVVGRGEDYSGTASITSSGLPCLPWDTPAVKDKLAHQITLQEWSSKLSGHNFCRNLGRQELHPWCFVAGKENSEYCSIPQCWDSVPGYSKSANTKSSCDETEFECRTGECIKRKGFCDGRKDCSNGRDEAMCNIFLQEFSSVGNKRMKGHGREKWANVNENTCAKICLEAKKFRCKSFSFHAKKRTCLLSDTNVGLSGQVVEERGWTYHELHVASVNCTLDKGLMGCRNGKCVNASNICDGKDNCGDGSDEVDCSRLGYQIRLAGSNETHKGRVEVRILGIWGVICDDKFDLRDGAVVCRELGFKHGVAEILPKSHFPKENPVFVVDDLECFGNETSIRECSFPGWGRHDCKPEENVGVVCRIPDVDCPSDQWHCSRSKECIPISFLCDTIPDCNDESDEDERMCNKPITMRLSGGPNATAGRLEIQYLGTWGTICDDAFNDKAASVVCRTLGHHGPATVLKNSFFGPGKGPIWLDGVQCFGNETNMDECVHSDWGKHNCKHDEDVSVICSELSIGQKSSAVKPIAESADIKSDETPMEKLRSVLLKACSEDGGQSLQSKGERRERVIGSDVVPEGVPWQASVRVRSIGGKTTHWCGAIVISPYHILTAGHCLRDYSKPAYFIRVGDFDTEVPDPEEQEFGIDHLYIHPEFNRKVRLNNDIALVKIKGEIRLGDRVKPACLAPSSDIYRPGTNCSISGWGSVSSGSVGYARTLRRAYIPILEPSLCKAPFVYGDNLSDGMFCAGKLEGGVDSCQGDSGGPIMCQHEEKEYLFGITSWGHGCGRANKPGVYTNVARYSEWIQEKILVSLS